MADPITVIQTLSAVGDIVAAIYQYGNAVKDAPAEISELQRELFGLKGALEHIAWSIDGSFANLSLQDAPLKPASKVVATPSLLSVDSDTTLVDGVTNEEKSSKRQSPLWSSLLDSDESQRALNEANVILGNLLAKLQQDSKNRAARLLSRLTWPIRREETLKFARHLERVKTYFILATTSDNLSICKQIYSEIRDLRNLFEEHQQSTDAQKLRTATSQWLSPCTPDAIYQAALSARQDNTGQWFLKDSFPQWFSIVDGSAIPLLWLRGKPGSGKTTLFSSCVQLLLGLNYDFAYFFCSVSDPASQEPVNVLGSLLTQICDRYPRFWNTVEPLYQQALTKGSSSLKRPEHTDVAQLLATACRDLPAVYLLLDAPNESSHSSIILETLLALAKDVPSVRLLVSSTEDMVLLRNSSHCLSRVIDVTPRAVHDDINEYIKACLHSNKRLGGLSTELREDVTKELLVKADGSFRWVQCQLDTIMQGRSAKDIRTALHRVPRTLEETYVDILSSISPDDSNVVRRMLMWITFTFRSLSMLELSEAMAFEGADEPFDQDSRLLQPMDFFKAARSLVRLDPEKSFVSLAHSSVFAFLTSDAIKQTAASFYFLDPTDCASQITTLCLEYLLLPPFTSGYLHGRAPHRRAAAWPLSMYAAEFWSRHVHAAVPSPSLSAATPALSTSIGRFCQSANLPRGGNFGAWYQLVFPEGDESAWLTAPLYTAAREGLVPVIHAILGWEGIRNLESRGGRRLSSPLHVAATYGQLEAVKVLLAAGADPNERNANGEHGLQFARLYGHDEVVKVLIEAGARTGRLKPRAWDRDSWAEE